MHTIKLFFVLFILFFLVADTFAQNSSIKGTIYNEDQKAIPGVYVSIRNQEVQSDTSGYFEIKNIAEGKYNISFQGIGLENKVMEIVLNKGQATEISLVLKAKHLDLKEITVKAQNQQYPQIINKIDKHLRPVNSSQDLLRMVPGLFVAQHAGGGKAEQIFHRGFDADHGTDFAIYVDGMPVNMPSHAHGQGYADLHFLIPETVKELEVNKGPYTTRYGDLATSGSGEFKTYSALDKNTLKIEYGMFNTKRALLMLNILDKKKLFSKNKENIYIASEYKYTDAFFDSKQHFNRVNFLAKYTSLLNNNSKLEISASTFHSKWNASGQVPQRKIDDGSMTAFGSIDNTEGGQTGRTNINLVHTHAFKNGNFKNQIFYNRYDFNLYSNFTFFLNDSINGDQIQQGDHRNIIGYNSTLNLQHTIGKNKELNTSFGTGLRYDNSDVKLLHTIKRVYLHDIVKGKLNQLNAWLYADATLNITSKLKLNTGARLDVYNFDFQNETDPLSSGVAVKALISPKVNLTYTANNALELFTKSGYGFHSNDARAVVVGRLKNTLPRAFGYEAGSIFKPTKNLLVQTALWALHLQSELIYVGDEGIVEIAGRTKRYGADLGVRYQLLKNIYVDADINYSMGRLIDEPVHANRIPLAPVITSVGGVTYKQQRGFSSSLRYRCLGDRPANEDYSLTAKGYFLLDAVVNFTQRSYQLGLSAENILDTQWREAQFATESRLQNEPASVEEIHFTPGTPLFIKASLSIFF